MQKAKPIVKHINVLASNIDIHLEKGIQKVTLFEKIKNYFKKSQVLKEKIIRNQLLSEISKEVLEVSDKYGMKLIYKKERVIR